MSSGGDIRQFGDDDLERSQKHFNSNAHFKFSRVFLLITSLSSYY